MKLQGKVAIVSGGSRGIGFAVAKLFSEEGANVVITSKDSQKLDDATSKLQNIVGVQADIKNQDEVDKVVQKTFFKAFPMAKHILFKQVMF